MEAKQNKVRTLDDCRNHPLIEDVIKNYDGPGTHMVECIEGYRFDGEATISIGSVADCCYMINTRLWKNEV